ncbi:hypothetical protein P692DRAFT_20822703 [Suillus brevipes Sb2]|nr:hypothetical protein P692DRAFT_20822703 [Suillus brevipes Sb2]
MPRTRGHCDGCGCKSAEDQAARVSPENSGGGHNDALPNEAERTADNTPVVSSTDVLYNEANHTTGPEIALARLPTVDQLGSILRTKSGYPALLERTMSVFSQHDNSGNDALPDGTDNVIGSLAVLRVHLQAVITGIARKIALTTIIFMVAFVVKDSRLLRLTDHLVFTVESGVEVLISAYLSRRGIEEREVLRCMGAGGTVLYALAFLVMLIPCNSQSVFTTPLVTTESRQHPSTHAAVAARAACTALVTQRQGILIQPTTSYFDVLESTLHWRTAEQSRASVDTQFGFWWGPGRFYWTNTSRVQFHYFFGER